MSDDTNGAAVTAVVIVDHGSRRAESNAFHERFVADWQSGHDFPIVEPAHMEMAEPSISVAVDACIEQGATHVIIAPFFLWPGRHMERDIPELVAEAAERHADVSFTVAEPLGPHPLLGDIVAARVEAARS
ncbi:MAG: CbiX/SirB N-terminal domain-containing protein [Actinomycetota bacterium]